MILVTISACKSGSGMQTANNDVRDVVAMSGKAASEGIARASGLLFIILASRRRCKSMRDLSAAHVKILR